MLRHECESVTGLRKSAYFEYIDLHLANCLCSLAGKDLPNLSLGAALASRATGMGHICLDLAQPLSATFAEAPFDLPQGQDLLRALDGLPGVGAPGDFEPLILDGTRLYLARYHHYEKELAQALLAMAEQRVVADEARLAAALRRLFPVGNNAAPDAPPDMQRVAAFAAARNRLTVITGGPGTGKTTTVARIVALLAELEDIPPSRIGLAAPTGKAAARLSESLQGAFAGLALPPSLAGAGPLGGNNPAQHAGHAPGPGQAVAWAGRSLGVPGARRGRGLHGRPAAHDQAGAGHASRRQAHPPGRPGPAGLGRSRGRAGRHLP